MDADTAINQKHDVDIHHIESRESKNSPEYYDFIVLCQSNSDGLQPAIQELKGVVKSVKVINDDMDGEVPPFPKRLSDLDGFSAKVLKGGADLKADHPGFKDEEYKERRKQIVELAKNYKQGDPLPDVKYSADETKTWNHIYNQMVSLHPTHACKEYNEGFQLLKEKNILGPDKIPQFEEVSRFLRDCTGFTLRPVAGLLSIRNFLAGFAFRVFHATQYVRHGSQPEYTPEPDVCHELLGHVPMFANPEFAQFTQELGLASLGAPDEYIKSLGRLFWFTVEFGLCREGNDIKAYGAGLLSSYGEIQYCLTDEPEKKELDPVKIANRLPRLTQYQSIYYIADSFKSAKEKIRAYAAKNPRPFDVQYDSYTHSIEVMYTKKGVIDRVKRLCVRSLDQEEETTVLNLKDKPPMSSGLEPPIVAPNQLAAQNEGNYIYKLTC